jgi:hypothetical protein
MHNPNPFNNEQTTEEQQETISTDDVLEISDRSLGMRNRKSSTEALHGSREDILLDELGNGNLAGASMEEDG